MSEAAKLPFPRLNPFRAQTPEARIPTAARQAGGDLEAVLLALKTTRAGLSEAEARLEAFGANEVAHRPIETVSSNQWMANTAACFLENLELIATRDFAP